MAFLVRLKLRARDKRYFGRMRCLLRRRNLHRIVTKIEVASLYFQVSLTPTTVFDVIKKVRNITSKSSKLVQKDLSITVNILDKVVKTNVTSPDVGDHMLGTLSHVMDAKPEALQNIQQENNRSAR